MQRRISLTISCALLATLFMLFTLHPLPATALSNDAVEVDTVEVEDELHALGGSSNETDDEEDLSVGEEDDEEYTNPEDPLDDEDDPTVTILPVEEAEGTGEAVVYKFGLTTNPDDYWDPTYDVKVQLIWGTVTWDKATETLTLQGATVDYISFETEITICLEGTNVVTDTITAGTYCDTGMTIEGPGSLSIANPDYGISCGNLTILGGTINIKTPTYAGIELFEGDFIMRGGELRITNSYDYGISVCYGNFTMTGGTLVITDTDNCAINVLSNSYRDETIGGKVSITGGSLTATCNDANYVVIYADESASCKAQCLKKCKGWLCPGVSFSVGGNEYKRLDWSDYTYDYLGNYRDSFDISGEVTLVRYGNSEGKTPPTTVSFGGNKYVVASIANSAYGTNGLHRMSGVSVPAISVKTFTGKAIKPAPKITYSGKRLVNGTDYTLSYSRNIHAGTAVVYINGKGRYIGRKIVKFTINKARQPMQMKVVNRTVKFASVKKKAITVAAPFSFTKKPKGTVTYSKVSGSACLTINKYTGKVTVKKGTKKGKYTIRVKAAAKGNADYKAGSKTIVCTVYVKA